VDWLLTCLDPLTLLRAEQQGLDSWWRLAEAALLFGGLGSACLLLAVWRLRPAYMRSLERPAARRGVWRPRPAVGEEPVRWCEQHVVGLAAGSRWRRTRWLSLAAAALTSGLLAWEVFCVLSPGGFEYLQFVYAVGMTAGVAVVAGVRSAGAISGERERGTWDLLLLSPMSATDLVREKFQGIQAACLPWLFAAAVPLPLFEAAMFIGRSSFWPGVLVLLTVYLWFVLRWAVSAGLGSSAAAQTSWRSLVKTLGVTGPGIILSVFGGCFVVYYPAEITQLIGTWQFVCWPLGTAAACFVLEVLGRTQRKMAVERVAKFDRIEQWRSPARGED
jgi:hypothetical protein